MQTKPFFAVFKIPVDPAVACRRILSRGADLMDGAFHFFALIVPSERTAAQCFRPRIVQNVAGIEQTALDNRAERNARLTLFGTELKTKFVFDALHGINARLCAFDIMLVLFNADKIAAELFGYGAGRPPFRKTDPAPRRRH